MRFYSSSFPADEITKKRWATRTKNRGGLVFPSEDVYHICLAAEQTFRMHIGNMHQKNFVHAMTNLILRKIGHDVFLQDQHFFNQEILNDHRYQLITLVTKSYLQIRIRYELRVLSQPKEFQRRRTYHKLIHFTEATRIRNQARPRKSCEI